MLSLVDGAWVMEDVSLSLRARCMVRERARCSSSRYIYVSYCREMYSYSYVLTYLRVKVVHTYELRKELEGYGS